MRVAVDEAQAAMNSSSAAVILFSGLHRIEKLALGLGRFKLDVWRRASHRTERGCAKRGAPADAILRRREFPARCRNAHPSPLRGGWPGAAGSGGVLAASTLLRTRARGFGGVAIFPRGPRPSRFARHPPREGEGFVLHQCEARLARFVSCMGERITPPRPPLRRRRPKSFRR